LGAYLRNLLLIALMLGVIALFVVIFYPETLEYFAALGFFISLIRWWPLIILFFLLTAIPWRRR
jgi:hypothetical protein